MIIIGWLANRCRTIQAETEKNPCKGPGLEKRIPVRLCGFIFKDYLTNQERCRMSATCRTFQTYLCADGFALVPLKYRTIFIQNAPPSGFFSDSLTFKEGMPLPFTCFDYDPATQRVITGDESDYSEARPKVWDRHGKVVKELEDDELWEDKSALSVHLGAHNGTQVACSSSQNGRIKIWNVATGERLFMRSPMGSILSYVCPSFKLGAKEISVICGARDGSLAKMDVDGSIVHFDTSNAGSIAWDATQTSPITWICDAPQQNRVYSSAVGSSGHKVTDNVIKIWDRTTGKHVGNWGGMYSTPGIVYDPSSHQFFSYSVLREVWAIGPSSSEILWHGNDQTETCTALHYDPIKKWVFAGFNYTEEREVAAKNGIFVWVKNEVRREEKAKLLVLDPATKKCLYTLPSMPRDISQIDCDPKTNTVLLAARGSVQLWDLASGRKIRQFAGVHSQFRWDKQNKLIVLFRDYEGVDKEGLPIGGTLSLLDYSSAYPKPESKEGKAEFKQESKEQPKKG